MTVTSSAARLIVVAICVTLMATMSDEVFSAGSRFRRGDVLAGVGDGLVQHYDNSGRLLEILDTGLGPGVFTTGCAFDSGGNLYITSFNAHTVTRFNAVDGSHGRFGTGFSGNPESILFDPFGDAFVGATDGDNDVREFDPNGNSLTQFDVGTERRGSDWIDLSHDLRTMFYTSEGRRILRYDLGTRSQIADFASSLPGSVAYAFRILPDGGVLIADTESVLRLDNHGIVVQTYDVVGENSWFSLNLDPDGTSFWAGDFATGRFYKFDIDNGRSPLLAVDTGRGSGKLFGLCVAGERTQALSDSDGDGLFDVWEDNGFDSDRDGIIDVNLPALGARSDHKDIFVYIDWLEDAGLLGHTHKPSAEAVQKVVDAFANAPISNADGTTGINLHVQFGQAISESAQNQVLGTAVSECDYSWTVFDEIKRLHFPAKNLPIYHYAIFAHYLPVLSCQNGMPSGVSRNTNADYHGGTSDLIVALGGWLERLVAEGGIATAEPGAFMHELGHNLGLGHGGITRNGSVVTADHTNRKANHLSVMNYSFQSRGLRKSLLGGFFFVDGTLDYSRFGPDVLPNLDEDTLDEPSGMRAGDTVKNYGTRYYCQGTNSVRVVDGLQQAVDWNCDDDETDVQVVADINLSPAAERTVLATANEWSELVYTGGAIGVFGAPIILPDSTSLRSSPEITFEEDRLIGAFSSKMIGINIKPGDGTAGVSLQSRGLIPVAILSNTDFDAPARVDQNSLTFGRSGDEVSLSFCNSRGEDVNGDGLRDLVCHFYSTRTGFQIGDVRGLLKGLTNSGLTQIIGVDSIHVVR